MKFSNLKQIEKSQTLLINEQSRNMENEGVDIIKFGFGQSPFLPPKNAIETLKNNAHLKDYAPVQGIDILRDAVAKFHAKVDGLDITKNDVFIAPGSKILIYSVLASFEKADVLVPAPAWVSYIPQSYLANHTVIPVECTFEERWRVNPVNLEKALAKKKDKNIPTILIINYPGNPDGLTYTADELKAIADVLRKNNVLVVSDEIYSLLTHNGKHTSLAKFYPEGTIVTGGLSKWAGAGGWRLGIALLPKNIDKEFKETMLGIASETYSCASLPVQMAAVEAYKLDSADIKEYIEGQRKIVTAMGGYATNELRKAGVRLHDVEGAFYIFPDFSNFKDAMAKKGITTSNQLCSALLKDTGVALLPGTAFGMKPESLTARLAYVEFNGTQALEDLKKVKSADELLTTTLKKSKEGIDRMVKWLKN
jgi:aspartate aminotransferase